MRKRVVDFQQEVFEAVRGREYVSFPPILYERFISTVKLRFRIRKIRESFMQFYYNDDNGKTSMAFVVEGKRMYGHDYAPKRGWHRHLPPNGRHNYSEEGRKAMSIEGFLKKVDELVKRISDKS